MVNDGESGSDDDSDTIPPIHHQSDGDNSSDEEDNDKDEEHSGPVVESTTLRQEKRARRQAKYLVPTHKGQSYDQGVAFHQVSHLMVSKGGNIKGQFAGARSSTKKGVLYFNFNEDTPCPIAMSKEQSDTYIVGVILAQQYSLKNGLELFGDRCDTTVTKELTTDP